MHLSERLEQADNAFLRLVAVLRNNRKHGIGTTLVMGAGCSLSSSTSPLTTTSIIREFMKGFARSAEVESWPGDRLWLEFTRSWDNLGHRERSQYLIERLASAIPGPGYKTLARLVNGGYISHIVTTNFDLLLDQVLSGLPARFVVGDAPAELRGSGNPLIEILKVHGDISHLGDGTDAPLRFSPRELDVLPGRVSERIRNATTATTIVVGYSGADRGFVGSLSEEQDHTAFWVLPDYFSGTRSYGGSQMTSWLAKRNGASNIIEGPNYGYFDPFMEELCAQLIAPRPTVPRDHTFLPGRWLDTLPGRMLDRNHHLKHVATIFLDLIDEACQGSVWDPTASPFAVSPDELCRASALVFRELATESVFAGVPRNEADGLLLLVASEFRCRAAQIQLTAAEILALVEHDFNQRYEAYLPHESFWNALRYLIDENDISTPSDRLEMWLNCDRRLTLVVNNTPLSILREHLKVLDTLRLLNTPVSRLAAESSRLGALYSAFQTHVSELKTENGQIVLTLEGLTEGAFQRIFDLILGRLPGAVIDPANDRASSKYVDVRLVPGDDDPLQLAFRPTQFFEAIEEQSNATCSAFIARPRPLNLPQIEPIERLHDERISSFLDSDRVAALLGGVSGSGKSESVAILVRREMASQNWLPIVIRGASLSLSELLKEAAPDFPYQPGEERTLVARLAAAVLSRGRRLLLIVDGLDEASGDISTLFQIWKNILSLVEILGHLESRPIKLLVTCREGTLRVLARQQAPQEPFFYFPLDLEEREDPWIPIHPLRPREISEVCRRSLKGRSDRIPTTFALDPATTGVYSRPILLLTALHYFHQDGRLSTVPNPRWAIDELCGHRLFEALPDGRERESFEKLLDIGFSEVLERPAQYNRSFGFAVRKVYGHAGRLHYEELLRRVQDVGLIIAPPKNVLGDFRFTHNLVEEHFLGLFLRRRIEAKLPLPMSQFRVGSYFGNGLEALLLVADDQTSGAHDRKIFAHVIWHLRDQFNEQGDLSQIVVTALEQRSRLETDIKSLLDGDSRGEIEQNRQLLGFLIAGMRRLLETGGSIIPERIGAALTRVMEDVTGIQDYLAELALLQSYCAYRRDQFKQSIEFVNEAARLLSGIASDDYSLQDKIEQQRGSLLAKLGNKAVAARDLRAVFERQHSLGLIGQCFDCGLELGAVLRDLSRFDDALEIYSKIAHWSEQVSATQASRLLLQRGTVRKNKFQSQIEPFRYNNSQNPPLLPSSAVALFEVAISEIEDAERRAEELNAVQLRLTCMSERTECLLIMAYVQPSLLPECDDALDRFEQALAAHEMISRRIEYFRERARFEEIKSELHSLPAAVEEQHRLATFDFLAKARALAETHGLTYQVAEADLQTSKYALRSLRCTGRSSFFHDGKRAADAAIGFFATNEMDGDIYMRDAQAIRVALIEQAEALNLVSRA
jgi:tetratricopeptide (TPR) repeat protein